MDLVIVHTSPAPHILHGIICKCALFGMVRIMLGRSLLVNYLPRLRLSTARRYLTAASSVRLLSRSYGRSDSDDRRGVGHSKLNSKESPTAKLELERSFQLLGVNKHDCTVEQIRKAYTDLVKRYHPDSRTPHASPEKSAEVCHNTICTCVIFVVPILCTCTIHVLVYHSTAILVDPILP